ncbi:hypothetical protein GALL_544890 [mine drainage metagenome]|uniref:Uncharacterized protein n=1 Tax=mine drainage metagenome TaxID=410659 RepID=A0A1J5P909_9ZZZZ
MHRSAEKDARVRGFGEGLKIVAIRYIKRRCGPGAAEVDDIAAKRHDRDNADLRNPGHFVAQGFEDGTRSHPLTKVGIIHYPQFVGLRLNTLQHQISGLEALFGMLREGR